MGSKRSISTLAGPFTLRAYGLQELKNDWYFPLDIHDCIGKTVRITLECNSGEILFSTITAVSVRKGELRITVQPILRERSTLNELTFTEKGKVESGWVAKLNSHIRDVGYDFSRATCTIISD